MDRRNIVRHKEITLPRGRRQMAQDGFATLRGSETERAALSAHSASLISEALAWLDTTPSYGRKAELALSVLVEAGAAVREGRLTVAKERVEIRWPGGRAVFGLAAFREML